MIHEPERTPRERRHDENLRRILDVAMGMVEEGGFGALSVNKLAEAVDYTPGALYRYFASKDELLAQLLSRVLVETRRYLAAAQAQLPSRATPLARVMALVAGYREFARREPARFGLLAMSLAQPQLLVREDAVAQPVVTETLATLQPLVEALADAARGGLLANGDAIERTVCVFALLQGLLPLRKRARHTPAILDVDRLANEGVRALLLGWGASSRAVDAAVRQVARRGELALPAEPSA